MTELPPIVLTGPTASGKEAVAFEIAQKIRGEIVSMDSMKVYQEMDVGTAKPSQEMRSKVRHHMIDVIPPDKHFSTGDYLTLLDGSLRDIGSRGRRLVICGGTALYLMGFLRGFSRLPQADSVVRDQLRSHASEHGSVALHRRLAEVDPVAAEKISPNDVRRIVRALEVYELSGKPISEGWSWESSATKPSVRLFGLSWERQALYERTDRRVVEMVDQGLFDEAKRLLERRPPPSGTARQCIGYKEILEGWESGLDEEEIIRRIQRNTRRFVKRQETWFRKLPIHWIAVREGFAPEVVAQEILQRSVR